MSNNVRKCQTSSQTVTEYVSIVLIHKYYVTDMTVKLFAEQYVSIVLIHIIIIMLLI